MSEYYNNIGQLEDLKKRKEICVSAIESHMESIRAALPLLVKPESINSEHIIRLAILLNEKCLELDEFNKKIEVLNRAVGR